MTARFKPQSLPLSFAAIAVLLFSATPVQAAEPGSPAAAVNVFIGTLIGSSLCAAISVGETTYVTQQLNIRSAEAVLLFLVAGVVYLALSLLAAYGGRRLEAHLAPGGSGRLRPSVRLQGAAQA